MPTLQELKMLQALPLDIKIRKTQERIKEWVDYWGEDGVYIAFSGGKDSTALLTLVRDLYPSVEAVFVNTGLEHPETQQFVKTFENVRIIRPTMRFDEVIKKYGYPFISKEVAGIVAQCRKSKFTKEGTVRSRWRRLFGEGEYGEGSRYNAEKWKPLLSLDFLINNYCCGAMKKSPSHDFARRTGKKAMLATTTEESFNRQSAWLKTGCNGFDSKIPSSKPMSFWTEQDILTFLRSNSIRIASVYGDIINVHKGQICMDCGIGKLACSGVARTGCIFCGFGAHRDTIGGGTPRFISLKHTHPRQYEYCMGGGGYDDDGLWKPTKDGLGMAHCIDELNKIYGKNFIRY